MSWHGPQQRGALAERRTQKRRQAEARQRAAVARPAPVDCSRKHRFATLEAAEAALLSCKIARALRGKTKRQETRPYVCRIHNCWHLTSKPNRYAEVA